MFLIPSFGVLFPFQLPTTAILPSETLCWPQIGLDSDCTSDTTVNFLFLCFKKFLIKYISAFYRVQSIVVVPS